LETSRTDLLRISSLVCKRSEHLISSIYRWHIFSNELNKRRVQNLFRILERDVSIFTNSASIYSNCTYNKLLFSINLNKMFFSRNFTSYRRHRSILSESSIRRWSHIDLSIIVSVYLVWSKSSLPIFIHIINLSDLDNLPVR
jgi:hypothetical protein